MESISLLLEIKKRSEVPKPCVICFKTPILIYPPKEQRLSYALAKNQEKDIKKKSDQHSKMAEITAYDSLKVILSVIWLME